MDFQALINFYFLVFLFVLKPGPGVLFYTTLSMAEGMKSAFMILMGTLIAHTFTLFFVLLGIDFLNREPAIVLTVQFCATVFIGYMGVKMLYDTAKPKARKELPGKLEWFKKIGRGMIWAATNPYNAIFYAAIVPSVIKSDEVSSFSTILAVCFTGVFAIFCVLGAYIIFADTVRPYLAAPEHQKIIRYVSALIFILLAFWIFMDTALTVISTYNVF